MQIEDKALAAFAYAKKRGFPHYNLSKEQMLKDFNTFKKYDIKKIIEPDNSLKQTFHCMGFCWSYFPHHWEIRTRKMKTPMDVWNDDILLMKAIQSRIKWGGKVGVDGYMSDSDLRKAVRSYSGVQRVSNFRPSAAAAIYDKYCESDSVVWDMSAGFGGRLVGAIRSGKVKTYIGNDPSTPTFDGLNKMANDFPLINIILKKSGSEEFKPDENVDLCFTSPPYFNTENYSDEITQSCHKFSSVESWNENFLRKTIQNCRDVLKENGKLILNVANVATHKTLEEDTLKIAQDEGFSLNETLQLKLSTISYKGGHKHEPIFVFVKK
jgi:hypothetical protein